MANFDRASRPELLKTIEAQQLKITKYEKKLRDLISAYKGLTNEKEALEASVKALSSVKAVTHATSSRQLEESDTHGDGEDGNLSGDENAAIVTENEQIREQIVTLMASLSTVTEEKSRMVANYQAEKKALKTENEGTIIVYEQSLQDLASNNKRLEADLHEWKIRLRNQQYEREKEQQDHAIMLREIQKLLAEERNVKEGLQEQLEDTNAVLQAKVIDKSEASSSYEKKIHELENEMQMLQQRIRESELKADMPSAAVIQLQQQTAQLKDDHEATLLKEQSRSSCMEERMKQEGVQNEERVTALESKLSQLSQAVGDAEKLRYNDQIALSKLRERLSQLEAENAVLAEATGHKNGDEEGVKDVSNLLKQMKTIKEQLHAIADTTKVDDITELLREAGLGGMDNETVHKQCQQDYLNLKEEFERYKLRAQSVLKNKATKDQTNKEVEGLRQQVSDLNERLKQLRENFDSQEVAHINSAAALRAALQTTQEKHKMELTEREGAQRQRLAELQQEIRRHRERTVTLLAEKDRELQMLRANSPERLVESHYAAAARQMSSSSLDDNDGGEIGASSEEDAAVQHLLARTSLTGGTPGEASLLHFAQEQARKDVEINNLRRQKHTLELALRELQHTTSMKEERYVDQIDFLKEEVRKHERNQSRESANLEYLKNVVYHYMTCGETTGRQKMLNAIGTILQFSPKEKVAAQQSLSAYWWTSPQKPAR